MKTIISGGVLLDPKAGLIHDQDIIISQGTIEKIVPHASVSADNTEYEVIDASGLIVSPGFIDMHMHEDPIDPETGKIRTCIFDTMLRMGVTTVVAGNCGDNMYDPGDYLDIVDRDGTSVNVAMLAGHIFYRRRATDKDRYSAIDEKEKAVMLAGLQKALDRGCVGISFGIRYEPGMTCQELLEVSRLCQKDHRLITAHVRNDAEYIFDSVEEFVAAGRELGLPMEVSHIGSMGAFGQMKQLLKQLDDYRAAGIDVTADCYPYDAFSTEIGTTTYDEGWLERYQCEYDACEFSEGKYKGQRCTKETFEEIRRDFPMCETVCYVMKQDEVDMALLDPHVCVGSDGVLSDGQGHPRAAGAFPRFYSRYVRSGLLTPQEGIRKMSADAAARLNLTKKGSLDVGADADLVLFDPDRLEDRATFAEPILPPVGIHRVIIGGETAVLNGEIVNGNLGKAVRFQ